MWFNIFHNLFLVLIVIVVEIIFRQKLRHFLFYVLLFSLLFLVDVIYPSKAHATDAKMHKFLCNQIKSFDLHEAFLTDKQRNQLEKKADHHLKERQRCFQEANKICLLIPDVDDKEMAISLFKTAIVSSMQGKSFLL